MSKLLACFTWQLAVVMNMILVYTKTKKLCIQYCIAQRIPVEFVLLWVPCDWAGSVMQERGASVVPKPIKICFQKTKNEQNI